MERRITNLMRLMTVNFTERRRPEDGDGEAKGEDVSGAVQDRGEDGQDRR